MDVATVPVKRAMGKLSAPVPWMLEAVILPQLVLGEYLEAGVVAVLSIFNAGPGFVQESRAQATLEALKSRLALVAAVRRDGIWTTVPAAPWSPAGAERHLDDGHARHHRGRSVCRHRRLCFVLDTVKSANNLMTVETPMWGPDYPHTDGIWPESSQYIEEQFAGLSADDIHKIACENAAKFYNLTNRGEPALPPDRRRGGPALCSVERFVALHGDPVARSHRGEVIPHRDMLDAPIIPERHTVRLPAKAHLPVRPAAMLV